MFNILEHIKETVIRLVKSRMFIASVVFCVLFAILVQRVFYLQIVKGESYLNDYKLQIQKTKEVQGTRGRILDRNGTVLADNVLAYSVTIEDNGDYDTTAQKNKELNATVRSVIDIIEKNGDSIINSFGIVLNDSGEYEFSTEGTARSPIFLGMLQLTSFLRNRKTIRRMISYIISVRTRLTAMELMRKSMRRQMS